MIFLLLQLDDLSTPDVCVLLDQESAFRQFFGGSSSQSSWTHSAEYEEKLTQRLTEQITESVMRQFEQHFGGHGNLP